MKSKSKNVIFIIALLHVIGPYAQGTTNLGKTKQFLVFRVTKKDQTTFRNFCCPFYDFQNIFFPSDLFMLRNSFLPRCLVMMMMMMKVFEYFDKLVQCFSTGGP